MSWKLAALCPLAPLVAKIGVHTCDEGGVGADNTPEGNCILFQECCELCVDECYCLLRGWAEAAVVSREERQEAREGRLWTGRGVVCHLQGVHIGCTGMGRLCNASLSE